MTAGASTLFAVALLASGHNSSITGTLAGQVVMEGFIHLRVTPWLRRLITRSIAIIPTILVVALRGEHGTEKLLLVSQVILSLQLSFAVIPLVLFTSDRGIAPAPAAKHAYDHGLTTFYVPEHTHIPVKRTAAHPGTGDETLPDDRYSRTLDPWVSLATAAQVTSRIGLSTAVALPVESDPITLAKTIATLDHLSGGRVTIGAGFGWNTDELEDHHVPAGKRRTVLREYVEACRAVWTSEEGRHVDYAGEIVSLVDAVFIGNFNSGFSKQDFPGSLPMHTVPDLRFKPAARYENACASGTTAIYAARDFIGAGRGRIALVIGVEKMTNATGAQVGDNLLGASYRKEEGEIAGGFAGARRRGTTRRACRISASRIR